MRLGVFSDVFLTSRNCLHTGKVKLTILKLLLNSLAKSIWKMCIFLWYPLVCIFLLLFITRRVINFQLEVIFGGFLFSQKPSFWENIPTPELSTKIIIMLFGFFKIYYNHNIISIVSSWQKHADTHTQKKKYKKPSYIFPLHTLSELHSFSGCFILVLLHSSPGIFPSLKNLTQNAYYVTFIFFFWMKGFSKILFWFNLHFTTYYYRTLSLEKSHGMGSDDKEARRKVLKLLLLTHQYDTWKWYYIFLNLH